LTKQQREIISYGLNILKPRPNLTGSQWINKHFYLSQESSAAPGKMTLYPWQEEIADVMCDFMTPIVVVKKCTRVGYTKMLNAAQAYFIHQRPSSILHAQPNDDEIRGYAEDEFEPMIRDNPLIAALIDTPSIRGRKKREKTIKKFYPGGVWEGVGAESERNFNRRTVRVFVADEIDTWKLEAGKAGDTLTTGMRRTSDFWDRKNIIGGKPIIKETSQVVKWFEAGDQRYRHWPCPHCGHYQTFEFEDLVWDKDFDEHGNTIAHHPETAHFVCKECGGKIYDRHKREMDKRGKWVATKPFDGIASFHVWAMMSYSPNVTWPDIVKEFLAAKDNPLKLKAFYNEVLARPWEEEYEKVEIDDLSKRKEAYTAEVPDPVLVLTCGVDTQDDRLECEVVGWGEHEESWSICRKVFHGDTSKPDVWKRLDEFLVRTFVHERGLMKIHATAVDTQGHSSQAAYKFCKARFSRNVFAIKGAKQLDAPVAPMRAGKGKIKGASGAANATVRLFQIGVNAAKDVIYAYLTTEEPGPGYMHFPDDEAYNAEYFKQLTSEKREKDGRWVKTRARNEALDIRVYAYAALFLAGIDLELLAKRGGLFVKQQSRRKRQISKGIR
jgi:phage terminase large subunit GpA-like protein